MPYILLTAIIMDISKKGGKESYTISQKQFVLRWLRFYPDGIRGTPLKSTTTNQHHTRTSVAKELKMSRTVIYRWMSKPAYIMIFSSRLVKKHKIIRKGEFFLVKQALSTYIVDTINTVNGRFPFREGVIRKLALPFKDKLLMCSARKHT